MRSPAAQATRTIPCGARVEAISANRNIRHLTRNWSGRRESNPRQSAWEADVLPLNYTRVGQGSRVGSRFTSSHSRGGRARASAAPVRERRGWCRRRGSNPRPSVYKTAALPLCYTGKEMRRHQPPPRSMRDPALACNCGHASGGAHLVQEPRDLLVELVRVGRERFGHAAHPRGVPRGVRHGGLDRADAVRPPCRAL
jgi:hypothetical protein